MHVNHTIRHQGDRLMVSPLSSEVCLMCEIKDIRPSNKPLDVDLVMVCKVVRRKNVSALPFNFPVLTVTNRYGYTQCSQQTHSPNALNRSR